MGTEALRLCDESETLMARCDHCGSLKCTGLCAPRAAHVTKMKIVKFLRAKDCPDATRWADEIEHGFYDTDDDGVG